MTLKHLYGLTLCAGLAATPAHAANWLQLQGTEPAGIDGTVKPWGFIQMEYQQTAGSEIAAGPWEGQEMVANQIGPDRSGDSSFALRRARLGVRGSVPNSEKVNYMLSGEFGNNSVTKASGGAARLFDASITVNLAPAFRVRAGQFKYPAGEEALAAAFMRDYINLTGVTGQLVNEKFYSGDGSEPLSANAPDGGPSSFHDTGVQLFGILPGEWEHSYAVMFGNGNGMVRTDANDNKELYLYWATERVFGGKGGYRQGWKLFAWHQSGERTLGDTDYDRKRSGIGTTLRKGPYRFAAEYVAADGMIGSGTDGGAIPGSYNNAGTAVSSYNLLPEDKADGWYLDVGYRLNPGWELDLRYDQLNRATDTDTGERRFTTLTLGTQYFINKTTRLMANYEFREAEAPGLDSSAAANQILDELDDRLSVQLQVAFK